MNCGAAMEWPSGSGSPGEPSVMEPRWNGHLVQARSVPLGVLCIVGPRWNGRLVQAGAVLPSQVVDLSVRWLLILL